MKINLDIVNNVTYKHVKFQYKICYIMDFTKMTNYGNIYRFENIHNRSTRLLFLCSQKYKVFWIWIFKRCRINSFLHPNIFSTILQFYKTTNMFFNFFKSEITDVHVHQISIVFIKKTPNSPYPNLHRLGQLVLYSPLAPIGNFFPINWYARF
jgi:hypothetical protein